MSQWIVEDIPNDRVRSFCNLQTAIGATKCEVVNAGAKSSDVLVEFPDKETYRARRERLNA